MASQSYNAGTPDARRSSQETAKHIGYVGKWRHGMLLVLTLLTVGASLLLNGAGGAAYAAPNPQPRGKAMGVATHTSKHGPNFTIICNIHDATQKQDSNHLGMRNYVECGGYVMDYVSIDMYLLQCGYWDYPTNTCQGGWTRYGSTVCYDDRTSVAYLYCPNTGVVRVNVASGLTVEDTADWDTVVGGGGISETSYGTIWHF